MCGSALRPRQGGHGRVSGRGKGGRGDGGFNATRLVRGRRHGDDLDVGEGDADRLAEQVRERHHHLRAVGDASSRHKEDVHTPCSEC